jgi:hypothetical protein
MGSKSTPASEGWELNMSSNKHNVCVCVCMYLCMYRCIHVEYVGGLGGDAALLVYEALSY